MAEQGDQARSEDAMNTCRLVARRAHCSLLPTGQGQFRGDRMQRVFMITITCPKSGARKNRISGHSPSPLPGRAGQQIQNALDYNHEQIVKCIVRRF